MKRRFTAAALCLTAALLVMTSVATAVAEPAREPQTDSCAECLAVIEGSSNRVLYGKNLHRKRPMASTTKIVTAICVIENCPDLEKTVTVPDRAAGVEGSSIYLERGEKVKILDLLYGLMLQSGNDCAETLAITTAGSLEKFADLMNATAEKIGATESHFVTPHGLHRDDHYTSAYDLAVISSYALRNPVFAEIVAAKKHTMPWAGRDYDRVILNKNKILSTFEGGDGVKTGFTKKAGRCLVSSATRNGMRVIAVALNCGPMFEECSAFMERAFREYALTEICTPGESVAKAGVTDGKQSEVAIGTSGTLLYPLKDGEKELLHRQVTPAENLCAPVAVGQEAGKICFYLGNQLLFERKLITIEKVDGLSVWDKLKNLIHEWNQ